MSSLVYPRTPSSHSHSPASSSPLAPLSSPSSSAQARRRSQYKAIFTPPSSTPRRPSQSAQPRTPSKSSPSIARTLFHTASDHDDEPPRNKFLRERFKARCLERAQKARDARVRKSRRWDLSSEGDMDMEDADADGAESDDEFVLNDEPCRVVSAQLFRRIMASASRQRTHAYRVSYQQDVGSSIDPDMEDISEWERELRGPEPSSSTTPKPVVDLDEADLPDELDDTAAAELAAYAEECELWDELGADDDLFALSELDELETPAPSTPMPQNKGKARADADMDVEMS
ncbi:hypothetical protein EVG20_g9049 [Dentipellis fragilis]|uniref:Uncharacterized protein n=1 Tax=Dentipellis fragilis TaxID=205917 RepID=A0A4Y9Y5N4_9AGAM|nr:hypothetical protein EVG20_g9049 [Dentipellis fragilis]